MEMIKLGADFSYNKEYRYSLYRIWDESKPLVMFIGLNPSTAGETNDDPTIKSVIRIAANNGYGGVYMMNCWAYISPDPRKLKLNPMSEEWNNNLLSVIAFKCKAVVFCWGNFSIVKNTGRDKELIDMFPNALCIKKNKNGSPVHPLYQKATSQFIKF